MWEEYRLILTSLRAAGFVPFYVAKQPQATPPPAARWGLPACATASLHASPCVCPGELPAGAGGLVPAVLELRGRVQ